MRGESLMMAVCGACPTVALVVVVGMRMEGLPTDPAMLGGGVIAAIGMAVMGLSIALTMPPTVENIDDENTSP